MSVKQRGFGSMSPEKRSAISKKGGDAAEKKGTAHRWSSSAAKAASQKGLEARRKRKAEREFTSHLNGDHEPQ